MWEELYISSVHGPIPVPLLIGRIQVGMSVYLDAVMATHDPLVRIGCH